MFSCPLLVAVAAILNGLADVSTNKSVNCRDCQHYENYTHNYPGKHDTMCGQQPTLSMTSADGSAHRNAHNR